MPMLDPNSSALSRLVQRGVVRNEDNALVPISPIWRAVLIVYFVYWPIIAPILSIILYGTDDPFVVERSIVRIISGVLALAPLVFPRFAGIPTGWLHPLIMPALVFAAKEFIKEPVVLIAPLLVWIEPLPTLAANVKFAGLGRDTVYFVMLKAELLTLLSQLSLLIGFIIIKWPPTRLAFGRPIRMVPRILFIVFSIVVAFLFFLQIRGGLATHINSLGLGRYKELGELGYIIGVFQAAPIFLYVWYANDSRAIRSPFFWIAIGIISAMQFLSSGTRAGVIFPLITLVLIHLWHTRRLPIASIVAVGLLAPLVLGILGQIRTSAWRGDGSADYSSIIEFDIQKTLQLAAEDIQVREYSNPYLPTIARVPDEISRLWGVSYIGGILFFVPRAIWPEKPRAIGAYAESVIMDAGTGLDGLYEGAGASPGSVAEAYWNFGLFGVVSVYFFFGGFLSWATRTFTINVENFAVVPLYTVMLVNFSEPGTTQLATFSQLIIMIFVLYWILGMWRAIKI